MIYAKNRINSNFVQDIWIFSDSQAALKRLKKQVKENYLSEWKLLWQNSNQGNSYKKFNCEPKWKAIKLNMNKKIWSSYMQLKTGHGYFKSYLKRLPNFQENSCSCHRFAVQNT